jgi:hypothetical protein
MCSLASAALYCALRGMGYDPLLVDGYYKRTKRMTQFGEPHSWLELDGVIYDITAGQFRGEPDVVITTVGDYRYSNPDHDYYALERYGKHSRNREELGQVLLLLLEDGSMTMEHRKVAASWGLVSLSPREIFAWQDAGATPEEAYEAKQRGLTPAQFQHEKARAAKKEKK